MRKMAKENLNFELEDATMKKENLSVTLIHAVIYKDVNGVKDALENGADVNATDNLGETALHHVNGMLGAEIAKLLIDAGADVNAQSDLGATPLHNSVTAKSNADAIAQILIDAGAGVNIKDKYGRLPLDKALREAHSPAVITRLVSAGAKLKRLNWASALLQRNSNLSEADKEVVRDYIKSLRAYIKAKRNLQNLQRERKLQ